MNGGPVEIDVVNVSKRYRRSTGGVPRRLRYGRLGGERIESWALRDVTMQVRAGETVGLIGSNGSGKSTLLRIIGGITQATRGSVRVAHPVSGLLTLGDSMELLMPAEENAITAGILAGLTKREVQQRMDRIAAFAELEDHMDQPLRTFSDGMRLRLAFSVAVHVEPRILLIDEILAVGDVRFMQKCLERIEELKQDGVTILLTSHVMVHIRKLADRVVWLANGVVRGQGDTEEIVERYESVMIEGLPEPEPLPEGGMRVGTKKVEIERVRLLGPDAAPAQSLRSAYPATIEVDYFAHERVEKPIFGIGFHPEGGETLAMDLDTDSDHFWIDEVEGHGTVKLSIERLDLAAGEYLLDVGIYGNEWGEVYDYLWECRSFTVEAETNKGLVAPPRKWEVR